MYEGSTIVEFLVLADPESEEPLDLEAVQSTFKTVMGEMNTFMGSPLLNAVSEGVTVETPNTPARDEEEEAFLFSD